MKVVRVRPDRSVEVIGHCDDFAPPKRAGEVIEMPMPARRWFDDGPFEPTAPLALERFECIAICHGGLNPWENAEVAVVVATGGPSPERLPGWRAAR